MKIWHFSPMTDAFKNFIAPNTTKPRDTDPTNDQFWMRKNIDNADIHLGYSDWLIGTKGKSNSFIMPPPMDIKRWCASDVCLTSVAYIETKSKTERPRKTKIGAEVAHVTCDSDTTFKVKRSKVKVTCEAGAATRTACFLVTMTIWLCPFDLRNLSFVVVRMVHPTTWPVRPMMVRNNHIIIYM